MAEDPSGGTLGPGDIANFFEVETQQSGTGINAGHSEANHHNRNKCSGIIQRNTQLMNEVGIALNKDAQLLVQAGSLVPRSVKGFPISAR